MIGCSKEAHCSMQWIWCWHPHCCSPARAAALSSEPSTLLQMPPQLPLFVAAQLLPRPLCIAADAGKDESRLMAVVSLPPSVGLTMCARRVYVNTKDKYKSLWMRSVNHASSPSQNRKRLVLNLMTLSSLIVLIRNIVVYRPKRQCYYGF